MSSPLKRELSRLAHVDLGFDENGKEKKSIYKTTALPRLRDRANLKARVAHIESESSDDAQTTNASPDDAQSEELHINVETISDWECLFEPKASSVRCGGLYVALYPSLSAL